MDGLYRVRRARPADLPVLAAMERRVFPAPWSEEDLRASLGNESFVAVRNDAVVGYVLGRVAAPEGEIVNLAVDPAHRRRGVGRRLLAHALTALGRAGARVVFLEVRESNRAARALYARVGFREVGRRPSYYRAPAEDALVLARSGGPETGSA